MKEIVNAAQLLLEILAKHHGPREKIKAIDKVIEKLNTAVYLIESNWIPRKERLPRALARKKDIDAMVKFYEDTNQKIRHG